MSFPLFHSLKKLAMNAYEPEEESDVGDNLTAETSPLILLDRLTRLNVNNNRKFPSEA